MTALRAPEVAAVVLGTRLLTTPESFLWRALRSVYGSLPLAGGCRDLMLELSRHADGAATITFGRDFTVSGRGSDAGSAAAAAAFALFHPLARDVTDYLIVHAGVVRIRDRTILLAAPSRIGKTTLTVALALRGAAFLSDEAAPISRDSHVVAAFPRAVGLRSGPLMDDPRIDAATRTSPRVDDRGGRSKFLVDLVGHGLAAVGAGARVDDVVLLEAGTPSGSPTQIFRLDIDRVSSTLASSLRRVPGILAVAELGDTTEPALRFEALAGVPLSSAIDEACRRSSVTAIRLLEDRAPDFRIEPSLTTLEPSRGIMRLARHVENGPASRLLVEELGGSAPRLVAELARLLGGVRFWTLGVGRLERMCELVEQLP